MVLDLFSGGATPQRAGARRRPATRTRDGSSNAVGAESDEDSKLFANCVSQVQRHLKTHVGSPSTLHTLASYYTRVEPYIDGKPFCVSLSYATFLFHMQMSRIGLADVDLYVQLIANVLGQLDDDEKLAHPFVLEVIRDHVFGLPSPTCRGGAHCVVLVPPQLYRAYACMTTALLALDVVGVDIVYQFQDRLEFYCSASAPIIANRALALLVQTVSQVRIDEQVTALQYVLKTKPVKMNVDFLLACYERLKRAVIDPANGPSFGRALSIHCSELFLRFRSPIRREYVERFLYPSLCHPDMADFLAIPATRAHLMRELLSQCPPGLSTANPFYMCLCAVMQDCFNDEIDGALETVTLINCQMPHAAYFTAALAIDTHMSVSMFAKVVIALARGAGIAMTGRDAADEVAVSIKKDRTSVYNVLFMLREVVRSCSITASKRATDMLKALRVAMPMKTIEALGKLAEEAFDGECDITVDPQLLCAELAMVLHHEHVVEAMTSAVDYFRDVTAQCHFCGAQRSASLLCPVNGTVHVTGQSSVSRVLATLAECAGSKVVEDQLIRFLREPNTQMDSAVHFLVFHIVSNAGQHRNALFVAIEPYIRSTLMTLVNADRNGSGNNSSSLISSEQKANVLMLHVKVVILLSSSIDPTYLESIIKVFSELRLRTNHDALALWCMCNLLLRNCKGNIDLLPTDPQENNYSIDYPGCAPTSATCADNAQLVLKLLDRAHAFSAEMRKLVGCCVCKLIQDFNMQAPNLIGTLLSSYGLVPIGLQSLNEFALPVGAGSTFWGYFLNQMKTSAPARTAFMAALAKSMSRRFRIASPVEAIAPYGLEPTAHLFSVMMYEAIKRNAPLARVVLFMVSNWMKQAGHQPGKYVCLVYICVQLVTAVLYRGEGSARVELEAETRQDQHQFDDAVKKASKALSSQKARLEHLIPAVRDGNVEFFRLVRRLQRKVRRTIATANGEMSLQDVESGYESAASDQEAAAYNDARGVYMQYIREHDQIMQQQQRGEEEGFVTIEDLRNEADDSVFDTNNTNDGDDYYQGGVDGTEGYAEYASARKLRSNHTSSTNNMSAMDDASGLQVPSRVSAALQALSLNSSPSTVPLSGASKRAGGLSSAGDTSGGTTSYMSSTSSATMVASSTATSGSSSGQYPTLHHSSNSHISRPGLAHRSGQTSSDYAVDVDADGESQKMHGGDDDVVPRSARYLDQRQYSSRSQSKGVQTDDEREEDNKGVSPAVRPVRMLHSHSTRGDAAHRKRSVDKGVTVPFEVSVGTSPINFDEEQMRRQQQKQQETPKNRSQHSAISNKGTNSSSQQRRRMTAESSYQNDDDDYGDYEDMVSPRESGRGSVWQEPELFDFMDGDEAPIDNTAVPRLQGSNADGGVVLPSGMVIEYLRAQQGMDSLTHELQQAGQGWMPQQVADYVAAYGSGNQQQMMSHDVSGVSPTTMMTVQPVTVEGRANNYGRPHTDPSRLAEGHTVMAPVRMVDPRLVQQQPRRGVEEVVDGEHEISAVSGADGVSKRRRMEQQQQHQQQLPQPQSTPTAPFRGMQFFLSQNAQQHANVASALDDLHGMQQQKTAMDKLAHESTRDFNNSQQQQLQKQQQQQQQQTDENTPAQTLRIGGEGLVATTPYGQVMIPACLVEQNNRTAVQELRQVMGEFNPNHARLSMSGKRQIRGRVNMEEVNSTGEGVASNAEWWATMNGGDMSETPNPEYTTDPQYSMELF